MAKNRKEELILWFDEVTNKDVSLVGGKNAVAGGNVSEAHEAESEYPERFRDHVLCLSLFYERVGIDG